MFGGRADADEARQEEWRAAHLLLSVAVAVHVPENLTRFLCGKTAPPLPATPAWPSRLIHKEGAATWSKYFFTREAIVKRLVGINDEDDGAFKSTEGVSLGAIESLPTDPTRVRQSVHKRQENRLSSHSGRWLGEPAPAPPAPPPNDREDPPDSPKVDVRRASRPSSSHVL